MSNVTSKAIQAIKTARNSLMLHQPFFGPIAFALNYEIVHEDDPIIITAATDNETVFFNPKFMLSLSSVADREFVQLHEIMHVITMTLQRAGSRDKRIWNAAADYCINAAIVNCGLRMPTIPDEYGKLNIVGLYDKKYDGMIPEEIYELLIKDENFKGGSLDQHVDGKIVITSSGTSTKPRTARATEALKRRIKSIVAQASLTADPPMSIKRMIEITKEPQINWKDVIASKMLSMKSSDYGWNPPEKNTFWSGITLPSVMEDSCIKASLVLDVSGSIDSEMLNMMFTEVLAIASDFSSWEIQLILFDTEVHNPKIYSSDTDTDTDIMSHDIDGGGGTLFEPFFRYIKESEFAPDVVIVFTDGFSSDGWQEQYSDTFDALWVLSTSQIPSWGQYVKFDMYS